MRGRLLAMHGKRIAGVAQELRSGRGERMEVIPPHHTERAVHRANSTAIRAYTSVLLFGEYGSLEGLWAG